MRVYLGGNEPEIQLFVVRCTREPHSGAPTWRTWVEHVLSGQRTPLADLGQLQQVIEQYLSGKEAAEERK